MKISNIFNIISTLLHTESCSKSQIPHFRFKGLEEKRRRHIINCNNLFMYIITMNNDDAFQYIL